MDDGGGGGGGGGGRGVVDVLVVDVVVVHVWEVGLIGGCGGGGGAWFKGGGAWWCWSGDSAAANWSKAAPVFFKDFKYIVWAAENDCLALTNCFMYLFLPLHLETISLLSNLE